MDGKEPLMKAKVTHTGDGGSILAISFAHVIAGVLKTTLLAFFDSSLCHVQMESRSRV